MVSAVRLVGRDSNSDSDMSLREQLQRNGQSALVDWLDQNLVQTHPDTNDVGASELRMVDTSTSTLSRDHLDDGDALRVLLPVLIILSTLLFILLVFLISLIFVRRRRGIALRDNDGPIDMSREEIIDGEGGFEGVESRWLEAVSDDVRRGYRRAKDWQVQYPPNSLPTDITLSQFLAIQEKGVSAWSFEPDYEANPNVLVHSRTELTFLPDPSSSSTVQSNLPLPKLNEVYYWEVKMFDLAVGTTIAIGLATKPYPLFRLPGWNRHSIAYHSSGDKSYNYPFTAQTYGAPLKEGDVLGVGYRPRSGTVFFTRNGRKMEDAFVGLTRWNLFPTIGADGPCTLHVNLGQSGFVFIEANVKKWGLAPSVGTLAPPPAYGAERGSILLQSGGDARGGSTQMHAIPASPPRRQHRLRRPKTNNMGGAVVGVPMPNSSAHLLHPPSPVAQQTPPPQSLPLAPISEAGPSSNNPSRRYLAPSDRQFHQSTRASSSSSDSASSTEDSASSSGSGSSAGTQTPTGRSPGRLQIQIQVDPPPGTSGPGSESPISHNPPTPNLLDIDLREMLPSSISNSGTPPAARLSISPPSSPPPAFSRRTVPSPAVSEPAPRMQREDSYELPPPTPNAQAPPAYSPLDAFQYADGVQIDLPAEVIAAALEGRATPVPSNPPQRGSRRSGGGRR